MEGMTWPDVWMGLRLGYLGLIAGLVVAAICSYIGVYVVLKRIVFVGVSLSQISSAGAALAFLVGASVPFAQHNPMLVSLVVTLIGVLIYAQPSTNRRIPQESIIGIGYLVASALTLMFIVRSARGLDDVKELLDGSIIAVAPGDVWTMVAVGALVAVVHALFYKQFLFVSFDPEMAATQGYQARGWELLFYGVLGLTISVAIHLAGVLSVFAYLVIPAVTGIMAGRRMFSAFAVSIACGMVATVAGFVWALKANLPTSPPTIAVLTVLLLVVGLSQKLLRRA